MDKRFLLLPADHLASFVFALMYAVESGSDGQLEPAELAIIPRYLPESTEALIAARLLERTESGTLLFVDYANTQTSAAQVKALELSRQRAREKKQRQRARAPAAPPGQEPEPTPAPAVTWPVAPIPGDIEPTLEGEEP